MRRVLDVGLRVFGALVLLLVVGATSACVVMLPVTASAPGGPAAQPALAYADRTAWERDRPALLAAFEREVYGRLPPPAGVRVEARKTIPAPFLDGAGRIEQLTVAVGDAGALGRFNLLLVTPSAPGPHPVVVMQTFCGNRAATPGEPESVDLLTAPPGPCHHAVGSRLVRLLFGRYANAAPLRELVDRGYAVATFYAADLVPDAPTEARAALRRLDPAAPDDLRGGAIAGWAWAYLRAIDVLAAEPRLDMSRIAVWGHSRNGKSALLAAAADPRIALVIAHQAGRGGPSLSRSDVGESVGQITGSFPHWFGARYAGYAGREQDLPVDQHQLIALIAPRPVLLGAGARDRWADPQGAFRALRGAEPVYALYGSQGLEQADLSGPAMSADLAAFMRRGRHGVHTEDWRRFLQFLDAHLRPTPRARSGG